MNDHASTPASAPEDRPAGSAAQRTGHAGGDTRTRLLNAAEELFATQGIDGTSLRALTSAAGTNLAAVNYHFGSKERLAREVFARRLGPLRERRLARLDQAEAAARAAGRPLPVADIVRAFVEPTVELAAEVGDISPFARLVARAVAVSSPLTDPILQRELGETMRRFVAALERALPELSPPEAAMRFHFMVGSLAHTLANLDMGRRLQALDAEPPDRQTLAGWLTGFLVAGLSSPPTPRKTTDG